MNKKLIIIRNYTARKNRSLFLAMMMSHFCSYRCHSGAFCPLTCALGRVCRVTVRLWFPVQLCPRVWTSLENGRVTAKPPGPPVEGTTLHYSCHAGFILEGRNMTHCTKLGKWDAPKPTCLCE